MENDLNKYQLFWVTSSMLKNSQNLTMEDAQVAKETLSRVLAERQIMQLTMEANELANLVYKKLKESSAFTQFRGERVSETVAQVISKGQDFVDKVLKDDKDAIEELKKDPYHEMFTAMLPTKIYKPEYEKHTQKIMDDINRQLKMVIDSEHLTKEFKNDLETKTKDILEILEMVEKRELQSLDFPKFKMQLEEAKKKSDFVSPYLEEKGEKKEMIHTGIHENVEDYLKELKTQALLTDENISELFEEFGEQYKEAYNNKDIETLLRIREEVEAKRAKLSDRNIKRNKNNPFNDMKLTPFD